MKSHNDLFEIYRNIMTINNLSKSLTDYQKKEILNNLTENDILLLDKFLKTFNECIYKIMESR